MCVPRHLSLSLAHTWRSESSTCTAIGARSGSCGKRSTQRRSSSVVKLARIWSGSRSFTMSETIISYEYHWSSVWIAL